MSDHLPDPEQPEPELSGAERKVERKRLRAVRSERRRQMAKDSKARKKGKKGK